MLKDSLVNWRAFRFERTVSNESVVVYYSYFREIADVFALHHFTQLGGPDGKKNRDLWLLVKKYVHPMTAVICADEAAQYKKVDHLIPGFIHKAANHSTAELVAKDDKSDTINPFENENKHLKWSLKEFPSNRLAHIWYGTIIEEHGYILSADQIMELEYDSSSWMFETRPTITPNR
ncbi:hypothetical protein CDAR_522401 [Caerostris darwini]|uniref:Uncharacterized protein n=1 Tax=Caerostris darwini TaxID=1538125 RepID=A0AAV4VQU9_9ARAC|nr:hypothetical protein CDAR_522401 [Caerostris darwini]